MLVLSLVAGVALLPATGAAADIPPARGIDRVCPAPEAGTVDGGEVPIPPDLGTTHADAIACALTYQLVGGFGDGTYRPDLPVTREQMASFVDAWLRVATGLPLPDAGTPRFDDALASVHGPQIERLAAAGVVAGRTETRFGARDGLTRGQFTRVVANAISYADVFATDGPLPPAAGDQGFIDVPGTTFAETIDAMAAAGLARGTGEGRFDPQAPVTRGQLASFLLQAADYLDRHQRWAPTALGSVGFEGTLQALPVPADPGDDDPASDGGEADDGNGDDDGTAPTDDDTMESAVLGELAIGIDAFGGELTYAVLLTALPEGDAGPATLTLSLGDPLDGGEPVATLVEELEPDPDVVRSGSVFEAGALLRFADVLHLDAELVAVVTTEDRPDGVASAVLTRVDDEE